MKDDLYFVFVLWEQVQYFIDLYRITCSLTPNRVTEQTYLIHQRVNAAPFLISSGILHGFRQQKCYSQRLLIRR